MKAIILAAGMGTRLGRFQPKALSLLTDKKSILDLQVEKLEKKIGRDNIIIVVGYKKELIMERYPDLLYVYNEAYAYTNTAKSLLKALKKTNEDVIWLNGDVYFDIKVLDFLIESKYSACIVNKGNCSDEEVKYTINYEGNIHRLSKKISDGLGEALGINIIKKKDLNLFIKELEKVNNNDYFEKALENLTIKNKITLKPINTEGLYIREIDFLEDLLHVKEFLNN